MRENKKVSPGFRRKGRAAIASYRCCSAPVLFLVIAMSFAIWSLPETGCTEELPLQATSGSPAANDPGSPPAETLSIENPAPAAALHSPMMEHSHFASLGALYFGGDYSEGVIVMGELEKKIRPRLALFARIGRTEYRPARTLDGYGEGGRGEGFELGWRVYPVLGERKSFYLGAGAGRWSLNEYWDTTQKAPFATSGRRRARFDHVQFHVGWKFWAGRDDLYLNPLLQMGTFSEAGDDPDSGRFYTSLGLAMGTSW